MRKGALALSSICLVLLLGTMAFRSDASSVDERPVSREELLALFHGIRLTEGVLFGSPFAHESEAGRLEEVTGSPEFREIYFRSSRNLQSRPTPDTLANAAVIEAIEGDLDAGIDLLTRGLRLESPENPVLWNDLAVLYLERARKLQQPYDLVLALAAVEKAARGGFWEARFNRALALASLHLDPVARGEWEGLLGDSAVPSEWQEEAMAGWWSLRRSPEAPSLDPSALLASFEQKGPQVVQELVRQFPQKARSYGEEVLLGDWANLQNKEPEKAKLILRVVEAIGAELNAAHGDRLLLDSVRTIQSAEDRGRVAQLAAGHGFFTKGYSALKDGDCRSAQAQLRRAERALSREGSPFARWAGFYQTICFYFTQDFVSAESKASDLAGSGVEHYLTFEARLRWLQGLLRISQADSFGSLSFYLRSADLFEKTKEDGNVAALSSLVAENLLRLGQKEEAWKYREQALALLRSKGSGRIQTILDEASEAAFRDGHYAMARYLQDEVVSIIKVKGTAQETAEAYLRRILIHIRLGQMEAAEADFRATLDSIIQVPDTALRERLEADALLAIGEGRMTANPALALAGFDRVLSLYDSLGYRFRSIELRRLRALASEALGKRYQAQAELEAGILEVEKEVENLRDDFRGAYVHQADFLFDERIRIAALNSDNVEQGLLLSERARTLALNTTSLVKINFNDSDSWRAMVQARIPKGTLAIVFRVLEKETLVWSIQQDAIKIFTADLGRDDLREALDDLEGSANSRSRFRNKSADLFDQIVRSALDRKYERLVFIPDKVLWGTPFAALFDERTNRYLIEDVAIVVAPSLSFLSLPLEDKYQAAEPSILAVGDPDFVRTSFPSLVRLPNARAEAELATSLYPLQGRHILLEGKATVENFAKLAPFQKIIHFSGHAVETESGPLLLLAPDAKHSSGALTHHEIKKLDLSQTYLIVLGGCRTMRPSQGEGLALLGASFLAAGASWVVGNLWNVDDRAGESFFREFHRRVAAGEAVGEALRRIQVRSIQSGKGVPAAWAGYQVIGGL